MNGPDEYDAMREMVMGVVGAHFRPELLNRIDEVVVFHPLGKEHVAEIAHIQLQRLRERLTERDLDLVLTDEAMHLLVEDGFDPVYGARPLKRAIQRNLENPLAQELLAGKYLPGQIIQVDVTEGKLKFA